MIDVFTDLWLKSEKCISLPRFPLLDGINPPLNFQSGEEKKAKEICSDLVSTFLKFIFLIQKNTVHL